MRRASAHMCRLLLAVLLVALPGSALAQSASFEARDTLLVDAPAVLSQGTVRGTVSGGGISSIAGSGEAGSGLAMVLYSPSPGWGIDLETYVETGSEQAPAASLRYQLLDQERSGVNAVVMGRYKTVGFTASEAETEVGVNVGRHFELFDVAANAVLGRGVADQGMDGEGRLTVGVHLLPELRLGADARYRQEVSPPMGGDGPTPAGRNYDLLAGPTVAWQVGRLSLQALVGVYAPKFTYTLGASAVALASFDF